MSTAKNLLAGLGGAIALNILHESLKHEGKGMPRIDLLGEEALQKVLHYFGTGISGKDNLYAATLGGDLVSNTLYYSAIGAGGTEGIWTKAAISGISAGIGALALPEPMGLDPEPVTKTTKSKALTVGYYLAGALVTAAIIKSLDRK